MNMHSRSITLLCHVSMRGSHPSPDQLPGEHIGLHHILCSIPGNNHLQCCHTYTNSLVVDRSTVVGHVLMVHMCCFMYINHIDVIPHTLAFLTSLGTKHWSLKERDTYYHITKDCPVCVLSLHCHKGLYR